MTNHYRVAFVSLGCDKNRINLEQMIALVQDAGHELVADPAEGADVCIINTCGFIDAAKEEGIAAILQMAQLKAEGVLKKILVSGCLSQRYREDIKESLPEVDGLLGTGSYTDIVAAIDDVMADTMPEYYGDIRRTDEEGRRVLTTPPYLAYLKVAEGCSNGCAFCAIPKIRGPYRSRRMEDILAEAQALADSGVQELLLIAQDVSRYGRDLYGTHKLPELLRALCRMDFHWIRLHYLYPDDLTEELIDVIASEPKIVHYLDIPLQHCNGRLLNSMHRWGTKEQIVALLDGIRAKIPDVVLRTSLITGLPGESEAEFEELCAFLRQQKLVRAGVFTYSPEEGTLAAKMPDQVDDLEKERRLNLLVDVQSDVMDEYNESRLGETLEVLVEGFDPDMGCYVGRTYADSPDIDGHVYFTVAGRPEPGTFLPVLLTGTVEGDLMGEAADGEEE
ncbi:MAG: 30S ribosomal protein S12 methylthiotransferase RimO [Clostridiales bacterium]|nr:30S ribosomal protein S12 methylthiotransferase RimO [Clostridiales bacterium]